MSLHQLDLVFGHLFDQMDAIKHTGNVIHPPLSCAQFSGSLIEIQNPTRRSKK